MYMSREDFNQCCNDIVKIGEKIGETWLWRKYKHDIEQKYLWKKSIQTLSHEEQESTTEELSDLMLIEEDIEENHDMEIPRDCKLTNDRVVFMEHHIAYSDSYNVPVLYFNMSYQDGKQMSIKDIWDLVPPCHQHALKEKWSFITEQEHPYLQRPCFQIHPCHTDKMMKTLLPDKSKCENYVLLWLSAVAPIANLNLSLEYFVRSPSE